MAPFSRLQLSKIQAPLKKVAQTREQLLAKSARTRSQLMPVSRLTAALSSFFSSFFWFCDQSSTTARSLSIFSPTSRSQNIHHHSPRKTRRRKSLSEPAASAPDLACVLAASLWAVGSHAQHRRHDARDAACHAAVHRKWAMWVTKKRRRLNRLNISTEYDATKEGRRTRLRVDKLS